GRSFGGPCGVRRLASASGGGRNPHESSRQQSDLSVGRARRRPIAIFLLALVAILASLRWRPNEATARRLRMAGLATYPLYLIHDVFGAAVLNRTSELRFAGRCGFVRGCGDMRRICRHVIWLLTAPGRRDSS